MSQGSVLAITLVQPGKRRQSLPDMKMAPIQGGRIGAGGYDHKRASPDFDPCASHMPLPAMTQGDLAGTAPTLFRREHHAGRAYLQHIDRSQLADPV